MLSDSASGMLPAPGWSQGNPHRPRSSLQIWSQPGEAPSHLTCFFTVNHKRKQLHEREDLGTDRPSHAFSWLMLQTCLMGLWKGSKQATVQWTSASDPQRCVRHPALSSFNTFIEKLSKIRNLLSISCYFSSYWDEQLIVWSSPGKILWHFVSSVLPLDQAW